MPTPRDVIKEYDGNFTARPVREVKPEPGYNLFADPDYLFEVATELAREQGRIIFNEDDLRRER